MRFALAVVFFAQILVAQSAVSEFDRDNNRIFELYADSVESSDNSVVIAKGNASLISQNVYIIADLIKYNTKTREAEVSGNAQFYKDGNLYFSTQNAKVNFDEKFYLIEPVYIQDAESGVWISAKNTKGKDKFFEFDDPIISACEISDPVWRIEGTSGTFNQESNIVGIWNPRIYIKNVPVLWLPYIFLSTKQERSTGFLYPSFTQSSLEGFVYLQPFFIATHSFWDMTLTPQIRFSRGYGGNMELRFVDLQNQLFYFNAGFFDNFHKYMIKNNVQNKYIYGFNFNHERRGILSEFFDGYDDGLHLDFRFMNDVDYIRLQDAENTDIENRIQTSKANFFGTKGEHYAGLYFKYFLDLQSPTNDATLHTLPHFQYHKYTSQLGISNLTYSIDANTKNIMRYRGFGYVDNSVRVPLNFHLPIFGGYATLGASVSANAGVVTLTRADKLSDKIKQNKTSNYFSANYGFFIASDIAKHYNKFFHALNFKAELTNPLYSYKDDENNILNAESTATDAELYPAFKSNTIFSDVKPSLRLGFSQYFFDIDGGEILYHRMSQLVDLGDGLEDIERFSSLRNEIGFNIFDNISVSNTLSYSHKFQNLDEISFSINARYGYFQGSATYYLRQKFDGNYKECLDGACVETTANFLRLKLAHDFEYFSLKGDVGYDFNQNYLRDWNVSIAKDIRCFGIGLKFANEITPILTKEGAKSITNRYISLEFRFVPLTSTSIKYNFKESVRSND
ncbi:LPS-assembly protein LptD [Helicobacter sp. 23-1045]